MKRVKKKRYEAPCVRRVRLDPEEAILSACTKGQYSGGRWECPDCGVRGNASGS